MCEVEWNQLNWHLQTAQRRAMTIIRLLEILAEPADPAHSAIQPYRRAVAMTFESLILRHQTETDEYVLFPWLLENFPESSAEWVDACQRIRSQQVALCAAPKAHWACHAGELDPGERYAKLASLEREQQEIRSLELWPSVACVRSSAETAQLSARLLKLDTRRLDGRVLNRPLHVLHLLEKRARARPVNNAYCTVTSRSNKLLTMASAST